MMKNDFGHKKRNCQQKNAMNSSLKKNAVIDNDMIDKDIKKSKV